MLISCLSVFSRSSSPLFIHVWSTVGQDAPTRVQFNGESSGCAECIMVNIIGMFFSSAVEKCCANKKNRILEIVD